ncbi:MAG: TraB/GumN family protein [Myxococcales bacterium]|nr:TraB/GumN family protein [Myxococcales bacterium]
MRMVTQSWLALYAVDGLLLAWVGLAPASSVSVLLLGLAGLGMALLAVATPRVPARVVGPTLAVVVWRLLGAMPLSAYTWGTPWFSRSDGLVQLTVGALAVAAWIRLGDTQDRPSFDWRRSLGRLGVGLLGGTVALVAYVWTSWTVGMHLLTRGYVGANGSGITVAERTFERSGTSVHLVGMIHVGEASAYAAIHEGFCALEDAVVLTEATPGQPASTNPYGSVADALGLAKQPDVPDCGPKVVPADIYAEALSERTNAHVDAALDALDGEAGAWSALSGTPDPELFREVVDLRNEGLLHVLREHQDDFRHVVIPWGAAHLPGVEAHLLAEGWELTGEQHTVLIRYATVLMGAPTVNGPGASTADP